MLVVELLQQLPVELLLRLQQRLSQPPAHESVGAVPEIAQGR